MILVVNGQDLLKDKNYKRKYKKSRRKKNKKIESTYIEKNQKD
ncbi:unnamed protein product [Paramecium sonneborni]|uniref:Uncharacterized protein n=1 Tax=Paramecium sonneborni TaxID=65129 RepID=A0A8S1RTT9_9CILI|nr:unnamed protein product [Paramecium sonneborni]